MQSIFRHLLLTVATAASLTVSRGADQQSDGARLPGAAVPSAARLFADYYEERLKLFPLEATYAGDHRYDAQLPNDLTDSFRASEEAFFKKYLAAVMQLDRSQLLSEDQLSCDILRWECETQLEKLRFPTHLMPINQFSSLHLIIGQWANGTSAQPFKTVRDYENWLTRLDAFTAWCHTAVGNMREGIQRGWVLPKTLIKKTIPQMAALSKGPAEDHLFYAPIKQLPPGMAEADRARLAHGYAAMIREKIIPAFHELEMFLTNEYLPAGRESSGIAAIPQGGEFYRSQIKENTTTLLSAEAIHDLGKREVARLQGEMEKVKESVGFQGDLKAFFDSVRTRQELMPFTQPQQVLDHFQAIRREMEPALHRLFRLTPKTPLEIRRTEAFREASASAEWEYGSLDGTRPGIFYVPIPNVKEYNVFQDEALFLHEAIPGHHYQFSLQRENDRLPMFRRVIDYSAFGEGWALYCESLGKELGLYRDPYQYFGMLSMEMHRAIRLVVDTGLHSKGWTREQAIQYSLENEADSEASIVAEVERYMAWPGQALSYKIGQLKIRELRARAEQAFGQKSDIREFHEKVLESGCLPLQLLERKMGGWMQAQPRLDLNSQKAHAQLLEKAQRGKIDLYFEGDSITRRWGATDPQYKELLANWRENFFGWNAADFGWGGDTVENILWRLQNGELDNVHPRIIVLMAGTNNLQGQGNNPEAKVEEVVRGIEAIVVTMQQKAPQATIILMGITPRSDHHGVASAQTISKINSRISRLADGQRIRYLNINGQMAGADGSPLDGMTVDGLHLTPKGYQIWADALKPILRELLGPPAETDQAPAPTGDPSVQQVSPAS